MGLGVIEVDGVPLLAGKVSVVTGAGQGMGREIAIGLARAGSAVVATDVQKDNLVHTVKEIQEIGGRAWALEWNVSVSEAAVAAASEVRRMTGSDASILINNAGIHRRGLVGSDGHLETWREIMATNLDGIMFGVTAFIEQLKRTRGAIVNLASIQSFVAAPNDTTAYTTSKGAVVSLTKALAVEFARYGIRVNAVAPGFINTPQTAASRANPERVSFVQAHTPMKRAGEAHEIVGPVVFLASPLSGFVTGATLPVDGGFLTL